MREIVADSANMPLFSAASLWELAIKQALGRADIPADLRGFRGALLAFGWQEVVVTSLHALAIGGFPPIHKDPFDRILLAQAIVEGALLLTADPILARYPGPVRLV